MQPPRPAPQTLLEGREQTPQRLARISLQPPLRWVHPHPKSSPWISCRVHPTYFLTRILLAIMPPGFSKRSEEEEGSLHYFTRILLAMKEKEKKEQSYNKSL
jgi:hypothetical protein